VYDSYAYAFESPYARETLVEVHEAIDPTETVITHRHHGAKEAFNDLSGIVWGSGILMKTFSMTAHSGVSHRGWVAVLCPVMRVVISSSSLGPSSCYRFSVPSLDRHSTPDLDAEGLNADQLASMLHPESGAGRDTDIPDTSTASVGEPTYSTTQTMPSNNTNSDDADASDTPSHGLIRTTGPDGFDEIDPQLQDALDDGSLTEAKISKVIAAQKQAAEKAQDTETPTIEAESPTNAKTSSSGEKKAVRVTRR